ncbi:MAG: complex I subunit 5 family protein [Verrucomicrobia bacterium]|nr:complex I subunit 5 family protein [Verrucomicrobiota bacterium]
MTPNLSSLLLFAAVTAPMLTVLLLAVRPWRDAVIRATPLAALPALVLALAGPTGARLSLPWAVQHAVLELDLVGRVFLAFTSVLYLTSGWYARGYLVKDTNPLRFRLFFLLAMTGNFGLILAGDIPTFYTAFALMGLASAGLVFHRGDAEATRAGRIYLALAMVGEVLILSGFVFLTVAGGTTQIAELHRGVFSLPALLLLLAGFGIKAGALSLHFWLPLAHPAAPVPASAVLSGAMIKAGLLGWIRFLPLGEATMPVCGFTLISAGLGAAFLGTFVGVAQKNPKAVLAYSSISQMGIIMTGLGIGALRPEEWLEIQAAVLIYATHHALAKGSLFLGIGPAHAAHTRWQRLVVGVGLLLPALALAGAPFTSGALAKTALKANIAFLPAGWATVLGILLPLAAAGTMLKMARYLWLTWPRPGHATESSARGLWLPWLGLVVAMLAGVWLLPGALEVLPKKLSPQRLWDALWPLLVGGALAALAAWLRRWFSGELTRWLPAGDLGVLFEKLVTRVALRPPVRPAPDHGNGHDAASPAESLRWSARLAAVGGRLARIENTLRAWPVAGAALLLLIGVILWLLAVSRH